MTQAASNPPIVLPAQPVEHSGIAYAGNDLASREGSLPQRCAVAVEYVRHILAELRDKPAVFSTRPTLILGIGSWFAVSEQRRGVAAGRIEEPGAEFERRVTSVNAVERCVSVRRLLRAQHVAYGRAAERRAITRDVHRAVIVRVSLPAFSRDRRRALISRNVAHGTLSGGGWVDLLENQGKGQWVITASSAGWVS